MWALYLLIVILLLVIGSNVRDFYIYPYIKTRDMGDFEKEIWLEDYFSTLGEGDSD